MNVAQALLDQLANWEVKNIYGLVGDHIFQIIHELNDRDDLNFYPVKHEETAALMASAQAKLTGQLGVCLAIGGPGAVHLLNGVADAYKDRVPLLAITGDEPTADLGTEKKQVINQSVLFSGITCYCGQVVHQQTVGDVINQAISEAITKSMPAHVSIPKDILAQECTAQIFGGAPYVYNQPLSAPPVVDEAAKRLSEAKRPAVLVGRGVVDNPEIVVNFAQKLQAPFVATSVAKSFYSWDHPLFMGGVGEGGSQAATDILNEADLVLTIGANWWPGSYLDVQKAIIQVDTNPISLATGNPISYGLVGEVNEILSQLHKKVNPTNHDDWLRKAKEKKDAWEKRAAEELSQQGSPCHPASIVNALNNTLDSDAIISLDVGDHFVWFNRLFKGSGQQTLLSGKWRTLGFGLPAALAAKINKPDKQVVALVGDGGFAMTMSDFTTAVKHNLPVVVIIVNNGNYAMEKNKMESKNLTPYATELHNPDFKLYAESCGGEGYRVESSDQLESTIKKALKSNKPCIIDVISSDIPLPTV
ncbi:pyruvate dehydrogenase (quinone)/pyruvate oxidase [Desulfitispora alkaliphila]|uniref:thiamine pyrophosphate-binding protein n=1 Tax=Desulfitispora alkaliphila TaxID=622674 RepID=UPI003D1F971F